MVLATYAILRFLPFVETDEFANVGIVLYSGEGRYFGFRLIRQTSERIAKFFSISKSGVLENGLTMMDREFARVEQMLKPMGTDRGYPHADRSGMDRLVAEVMRPRESIFQFSSPRYLITQDPEKELSRLFETLVQPPSLSQYPTTH